MSEIKAIRLQLAADDASLIGDMIESLRKMYDQFYATHGTTLGERLSAAWPASEHLDPKGTYALVNKLTPPDERER